MNTHRDGSQHLALTTITCSDYLLTVFTGIVLSLGIASLIVSLPSDEGDEVNLSNTNAENQAPGEPGAIVKRKQKKSNQSLPLKPYGVIDAPHTRKNVYLPGDEGDEMRPSQPHPAHLIPSENFSTQGGEQEWCTLPTEEQLNRIRQVADVDGPFGELYKTPYTLDHKYDLLLPNGILVTVKGVGCEESIQNWRFVEVSEVKTGWILSESLQ